MSSGDEMNAWGTATRPKPRKKQRTMSPQPSTSKHLNKRTIPAVNNDSSSDDIELIDPPPNPPPSTARLQKKDGKGKAPESRPNGKDSRPNTKPESQVKGRATKSQVAKDGQTKPKTIKVAATTPTSDPNVEDASTHDDDGRLAYKKPPLNPCTDKELERWKSKVKDLEEQRNKLSRHLEELLQVRTTDAEQALEDLTALYENRAKTQESLISALQAQLASQSPFFRTSASESHLDKSTHPSPIPHFLTRATADAEQCTLQDELTRMRDELKNKGALVRERERRISELEQSVKDVRIELDAEIARSKELLARQPPPNSHHPKTDVDSKHAAAIRFYEDFSNLLVLSIKFEHRGGVDDDVLYTCMYTHVGTVKDDDTEAWEQIEKTITFSLRIYTDLSLTEDPESNRRVKYTPLELDKLSNEFTERLGFLANGFTFPHNQAALFLGSLARQMEAAFGDDQAGDVSVDGGRAEIIEVDNL